MGRTRYMYSLNKDNLANQQNENTINEILDGTRSQGQYNVTLQNRDKKQVSDRDYQRQVYVNKCINVTKIRKNKLQNVLIVLSSFLSVTVCAGVVFNMSVLNNEWMEYFQKSKAETSLVQSTAIGILGIGSFPSGLAITKFGPMKVGILGGCILALGLCSSFFATSIFCLVITIGIIGGLGFSLAFNSAMAGITRHFEGKQATLILAFVSFGSGLGGMSTPILLQMCIDLYGWRGTVLIFGGIALNIPVWAIICKTNVKSSPDKTKNIVWITLKDMITNGPFICCIIASALISVINVVLIFLVDFLESCGLTRQEAINIYFSMTLTATIFRLLPGILKLIPVVSAISMNVIFTAIATISLALLPNVETKLFLAVVTCCFGAFWGGFVSGNTIVVFKLVPREQFPVALGLMAAFLGIASIAVVPMSGHLRDLSGDYTLTFYSSSASMGLSCILFTGILIYRSALNRKQRDNKIDAIKL